MTAKSHPSLRSLAVVLVVGVALAGCGRKADPELPVTQGAPKSASPMGIPVGMPSPATPQAPAAASPTSVDNPGTATDPVAKPAGKKSFILDFLL